MSYIGYRFNQAILSLFESDLPKRDWLASHYVYHLLHLELDDVPTEIRHQFSQFKHDLTTVEAHGLLGSLHATVLHMNENEIDRMIASLVRMYGAIEQRDQKFG